MSTAADCLHYYHHYYSLDLSFLNCQKKEAGLDQCYSNLQCACSWEACLRGIPKPLPQVFSLGGLNGVQKVAFVTGTQVILMQLNLKILH